MDGVGLVWLVEERGPESGAESSGADGGPDPHARGGVSAAQRATADVYGGADANAARTALDGRARGSGCPLGGRINKPIAIPHSHEPRSRTRLAVCPTACMPLP